MEDNEVKYICEYCDRELKSNAGKIAHERRCKAKAEEVGTVEDEEIVTIEEVKPKVVQLEVMNGEQTYYMGHPRRLVKLRGLLSRTHDRSERAKICNMILDLENEAN